MNLKKLLVSDYDGTFYINDLDIKKTIDNINNFRKLNNLFVIATGRSYIDLKEKIDRYKIPYDYLILNHGALLLSKELTIIKSFSLDEEQVKSIINYANKKDVSDIILIDNFRKNVNTTSYIVKIMLKLYNFDEAKEIKSYIDSNYINIKSYFICEDNHYLVEVVSIKASKSTMIKEIIKIEGIETTNTYTIGDGVNDIDMVKKYNGYRVKNSCEELASVTNNCVDNINELVDEIIQ